MKNKYSLLWLSFFVISVASANDTVIKLNNVGLNPDMQHQPDSVALDNEYVRVMRNSTAFELPETVGFGTRLIVALDKVKIHSSRGKITMKRGEVVVFKAGESYSLSAGEFFEVVFKTNHPPIKGPEEWLEPLKNAIVYEDEQFRVFEERLAPGDTREMHSHAERVVIRLNPARLTDPRFNPDGTTKGSLQVPNTVRFAQPVVHVVKNISEVPLFNIVIEFKYPH